MAKILFRFFHKRRIQIKIMTLELLNRNLWKFISYYVNSFIALQQITTVNIALKFAKQIEYEYVYH